MNTYEKEDANSDCDERDISSISAVEYSDSHHAPPDSAFINVQLLGQQQSFWSETHGQSADTTIFAIPHNDIEVSLPREALPELLRQTQQPDDIPIQEQALEADGQAALAFELLRLHIQENQDLETCKAQLEVTSGQAAFHEAAQHLLGRLEQFKLTELQEETRSSSVNRIALDLDELSWNVQQLMHQKSLDYKGEPASQLRVSSPISNHIKVGDSDSLPDNLRIAISGWLLDHPKSAINEGYHVYDEDAWGPTITNSDCSRLPCSFETEMTPMITHDHRTYINELSVDAETPIVDVSPHGIHIDAPGSLSNGSASLEQKATDFIDPADMMRRNNVLVHSDLYGYRVVLCITKLTMTIVNPDRLDYNAS
jgi:hypothetical protein